MRITTFRLLVVMLVFTVALPGEGFAQTRAGKRLLWTGLAMLGGGIGATVYGTRADKTQVTSYVSQNPSMGSVIAIAISPSSVSTSTTSIPSCGAGMVCSQTVTGYSVQRGVSWGIVGPAVGATVGGAVLAIVGRNRAKTAQQESGWRLALTGRGATIAYSWQ